MRDFPASDDLAVAEERRGDRHVEVLGVVAGQFDGAKYCSSVRDGESSSTESLSS